MTAPVNRGLRAWASRALAGYRVVGSLALSTLLLMVLIELGARAVLAHDGAKTVRPNLAALNAGVAYYRTQPWASEYWREHFRTEGQRRYEPYVLWRKAPFAGRYLNIDTNGLRVTPGAHCTSHSYRVLFFGGSAAFGWGAPDSGTIAAYLQSALSQHRADVCVVNFAQIGWVSTQEVIDLLRELQAGRVPALAVFYDGYNDVQMARDYRRPGLHRNMAVFAQTFERRAMETSRGLAKQLVRSSSAFQLFDRFRSGPVSHRPPLQGDSLQALAKATAATYVSNVRTVAALADAYGFEFGFFVQPMMLAGHKTLTSEERAYEVPEPAEFFQAVYHGLESAADGSRFVYLGDAFDGQDSTIYIDPVHVTPRGNAIVADRIVAALARRLPRQIPARTRP